MFRMRQFLTAFPAVKVAVGVGGVSLCSTLLFTANSPAPTSHSLVSAIPLLSRLVLPALCQEHNEAVDALQGASQAEVKPRPPSDYDIRDEDEELEWDIKKENCSFCKMFLESPCKRQFQRWSKCVDNAKKINEDDFVIPCAPCTHDLMSCTSSHNDYFEELARKNAAEAAEEDDDDVEGEEEAGSEEAEDDKNTETVTSVVAHSGVSGEGGVDK